jgi:hypothetical protein
MFPPDRQKKPRWHCATCHVTLGRIYDRPDGAKLLQTSPALRSATLSPGDRGRWMLICQHGHATYWHGAGLTWHLPAEDAA